MSSTTLDRKYQYLDDDGDVVNVRAPAYWMVALLAAALLNTNAGGPLWLTITDLVFMALQAIRWGARRTLHADYWKQRDAKDALL